jgi:hypothetical protein
MASFVPDAADVMEAVSVEDPSDFVAAVVKVMVENPSDLIAAEVEVSVKDAPDTVMKAVPVSDSSYVMVIARITI